MEKIKTLLTKALLAVVLIGVGYALGKHSVTPENCGASPSTQSPSAKDQERVPKTTATSEVVMVYYMHGSVRCVTCNTIETMAKTLVDRDYASWLKSGRLRWNEVDFQKRSDLAKTFGLVSSCVVVANMKGEELLDFQRLDEVWTLREDPKLFDAAIAKAIAKYIHE